MKKLFALISGFRPGDLAPALGAYFGVAASTAPGWAPAASETAFLAWLAGVVLLPIAALDRRSSQGAAMLVVTAAWVLPPGASRGLAVTTLLVMALAAGAWRWRSELSSARIALPIALGVQVLLRAEELSSAGLGRASEILLPAMLTAVALTWLADERSRDRLIAVAVASVFIAGSFDVSLASAFLILAAATRLRRPGTNRFVLALAIGALLLLMLFDPRSAIFSLAATVVIVGPGRVRWIALVSVALSAVFLVGSPWPEASTHLLWMPIALPAAWLPRQVRASWLAGLVVAAAGTRILPPGTAPAASLLLLTWENDSLAWEVQKRWSGVLLAALLLMASYPWLRLDPALDTLARFGMSPSALTAATLLAAVALIAHARRWSSHAPDLALVALASTLLLHLPQPTISLVGYEPLNIGLRQIEVTIDTPATATRVVAVGASASNSVGIKAGTALATVKVLGRDGSEQSWNLKVGQDVGEWAARRNDLKDRPELASPRPWMAWSVPSFFGRSFRSLHALETEIEVVAVRVERHADLDPRVGLRIDHLDLRP